MKRLALLLSAAVLTLNAPEAVAGPEAEKRPWIHIRVDEPGKDGTKVNINLPLSAVDVALDLVKDERIASGRVKIDKSEISIAELRRLWTELRNAGDAELATVESGDDRVRVAQKGGRVTIDVSGKDDGEKKVRVDIPAAAVDALFSGGEESLDLRGAIAKLEAEGPGEFIQIQDGKTSVRVWIE